jgi:structural maintenance of chromosome 3 (chondroitin sulfate proteoglycan 6)
LKEVAGTKVYDERKSESEKLLEESKRKREKLNEVMERIHERITELEAESAELREYQNVEKNRRALQYALYKMHVLEAQGNIEQIEETKKVIADEMNTLKLNYHSILDLIETCDSNYQSSLADLARIKNSFNRKQEEYSELDNRRTLI